MDFKSAREVFEDFVPGRIAGNAELAKSIQAAYEFDIVGEGVWTLDFRGEVGTVREGSDKSADCFIRVEGNALPGIVENPMSGLMLLMTGQLKIAGEYSLAEHLIKVFTPLRKR